MFASKCLNEHFEAIEFQSFQIDFIITIIFIIIMIHHYYYYYINIFICFYYGFVFMLIITCEEIDLATKKNGLKKTHQTKERIEQQKRNILKIKY